MIAVRQPVLVRWFLIASLLLLILKVTIELTEHPTVMTTAGISGVVYLILFLLALLMYGWFALFRTRAATRTERIALREGTLWGLLCGATWIIELLIANLPMFRSGMLALVLYTSSAFIGYLLPVLPSLLAAWQTKRIVTGLQAGLLCGMFGGLMIFLATLIIPASLFNAASDPQTIEEFQRSGLPDMTTYIVGDTLAGLIAHLWIGLITGSVLGLIGGTVGKAISLLAKTSREEN